MRAIVLALVSVALLAASPAADSWPAAQTKEVFCGSREWFVRVVPGTSIGETVGFAGAARGPYARAEFYKRNADRSYRLVKEITLLNPVAPVLFLVTDRGFLITFDNWHNMGFGKAVASYAPDGDVIASYQLSDLFSNDEISGFKHSISSIWWRTETVYVRDGQQSVYVALNDRGSELIVEPETGAWQYCAPRGSRHLCRDARDGRWRPYQEPKLRP
jgi:hypothetical protein